MELYDKIIESIVGSTLHGTAVDDGLEDLDLMAVVVEPAPLAIGFERKAVWVTRTKPEGVRSEAGDVDHVAYGLRKYLDLALRANPTILLPLFAPPSSLKYISGAGMELRELAPKIVSKLAHGSFRGYMLQQRSRLLGTSGQKRVTRPELIERYGWDTKYGAHIVRLGYQGIELLRTGRITLPMYEHEREMVLDVRRGKFSLESCIAIVDSLAEQLDRAKCTSPLPEEPDRAGVEAWMVRTYRGSWHVDDINKGIMARRQATGPPK